MYSEKPVKSSRKRPRAGQVHAWASSRGIPLTRLHRELFPKQDVGYRHFINVLNGHRNNEKVFRKVTRRLAPDIARQLNIPQHLVRQILFPEK
ncbi:hypothetical protein LCGC14_1077110 [marine sediment metagenome]|uniref:Uncharacterized protein n=1 Tax=marine sediment metagenome TaxID=412755 RepID=A0A0F9MGF8_9ZZZZ